MQLNPDEEATVRQIAYSNTRAAYEAHTMLYLLYGEEYDIPLPPPPAILSEAALAQFTMQSIHFKAADSKGNFIGNPYPNPAANNLQMDYHLATGATATLKLYDMTGRELQQHLLEGQGTLQADVQMLPNGVYIYTVQSSNGTSVQGKFVLIK